MEASVDHRRADSPNELIMPSDSQAPVDVDERQCSTFKQPLIFWVRLVLGVVFIVAGLDKILHPLAFAKSIDNYQILPVTLLNLAAIILPWIELVLGSILAAGVWLPGAVVLVNLLLAAFLAALIFNVARGLNVDCGCFTQSKTENPATSWYIVRDTFFLLMGGYLAYRTFIKRTHHTDEERQLEKQNRS